MEKYFGIFKKGPVGWMLIFTINAASRKEAVRKLQETGRNSQEYAVRQISWEQSMGDNFFEKLP